VHHVELLDQVGDLARRVLLQPLQLAREVAVLIPRAVGLPRRLQGGQLGAAELVPALQTLGQHGQRLGLLAAKLAHADGQLLRQVGLSGTVHVAVQQQLVHAPRRRLGRRAWVRLERLDSLGEGPAQGHGLARLIGR